MLSAPVCLRVKGPFACFTRPEFHVERVSYPVITPSAARGILEAILMKPVEKPEETKRGNKMGFRWHILRIGVVREGVLFSILRNELGYGTHQTCETARGFDVSNSNNRAQRHSLVLKDVEYLIEAVIEVEGTGHRVTRDGPGRRPSEEFLSRNKYHQMFLRRAAAGQCYYQPFLGCREFSVSEWDLVTQIPAAIRGAPAEKDFGVVFRDFDFAPVWNHWGHTPGKPRPNSGWSDHAHRPVQLAPLRALVRHGWMQVSEVKEGEVVQVP